MRIATLSSRREWAWSIALEHVTTPFVLFGRDLGGLGDWAELERSLRLLQGGGVGVVAGAVRWGTKKNISKYYQGIDVNIILFKE